MRTGTKIAVGVGGAVCAVAIVGASAVVANNRSQIEVGAGFAAQAACVSHYLQQGATDSPDLLDDPMVNMLSIGYDQIAQKASGSLFGVYQQDSYYIEGVGCVRADERPDFDDVVPPIDARVQQVIEAGTIPQPEIPLRDPKRQSEVESSVADAMQVPGTRGVVVMKDGQLIAEDYGEGFDEFTPQLGWSMTKSVTNLLAGRLSMEDPDFEVQASAGLSGDKSGITYSDLLRNQSGLEWEETYKTTGDVPRMLYREDNMGQYVASKPLVHAPGTYRQYSTGSTTLACNAMQENSQIAKDMGVGMAWELLFKPVGMASAMLAPDASGHLACGSSAYATPRDWAKLGQFVANNGEVNGKQLLPDTWMDTSTTESPVDEVQPNPDGSAPRPYGSGWWLNRGADGKTQFAGIPDDMFWADGHDGQYMVVIPSENIVVVRQGFSPSLDVTESEVLNIARAAMGTSQKHEPGAPAATNEPLAQG